MVNNDVFTKTMAPPPPLYVLWRGKGGGEEGVGYTLCIILMTYTCINIQHINCYCI